MSETASTSLRVHEGPCLSIFLVGHSLEVVLHSEPANEIGRAMLEDLEVVARYCVHARVGEVEIRSLLTYSTLRRGFCAGADLRELHRANTDAIARGLKSSERMRDVREFLDRIHAVMDAIDSASFPTVAAVHGVVFGGGLELMLTHDVVVADKTARFAFPELRLGLIPGFGGIPRLKRDVGNAVVRDLLFTGRSLGAERANQVGLVAQLAGAGQAEHVARRVCEQMERFDAETTRVAKRFMKHIPKDELAQEKALFCALFTSDTVVEALRRFDASKDAMPYLPAQRTTPEASRETE